MPKRPPDLIAINHDDYKAKYVGRTTDGRQFFLTEPFEPEVPSLHCEPSEFVALYIFDAAGKLLEAWIDELAPAARVNDELRHAVVQNRLQVLGDVTFGRIEVAPFAVRRLGTIFGLVLWQDVVEDEENRWAVLALPGNYMDFSEPWDSGRYDT